jgi:hypothetical protein
MPEQDCCNQGEATKRLLKGFAFVAIERVMSGNPPAQQFSELAQLEDRRGRIMPEITLRARSYSPRVQLEIRTANERRELALELAAELEQEFPRFTLSAMETEGPEMVGERIRSALGVTKNLQLRWRDNDGRAGFNGWRNRIEGLGVLIFQTIS